MNAINLKEILKKNNLQLLNNWLILIGFTIFIFSSLFNLIDLFYNDYHNLLIYLIFFISSIISGALVGLFLKNIGGVSFIIGIFFILCEFFKKTWNFLLFLELLLFIMYITIFILSKTNNSTLENFEKSALLLLGLLIGFFIPSIIIEPNIFEQIKLLFLIGLFGLICYSSIFFYFELNETKGNNKTRIQKNARSLNKLVNKKSIISLFKALFILLFIILSALISFISFYIIYRIEIRSLVFYSILGSVTINILTFRHKSKQFRGSILYRISLFLPNLMLILFTFFFTILSGIGYMISVYQIIISLLTWMILSISMKSK